MVNLDRPEMNREALIYPIQDIEGVNGVDHYHGYFFLFPFDIRALLDDRTHTWFKGREFSDTQVLMTIPAYPYSPLKDREQFDEHLSSNITDAMDHSRHLFEENKTTWRELHLLFTFPPDHKLSSHEIYDKAGEDEKLEMTLIPTETTHESFDFSNKASWVGFTVARVDVTANKKGRVDGPEESELASLLDSLML